MLSLHFLSPEWWLSIAIIAFKVFAFGDAVTRREDAYRAADKKTKPFWLAVTGASLALDLLLGASVFSPLTLIGLVASIVYTVDVRPAIKQLTDGRGNGSRSNNGPYGPW
ncbi:DUF2516 family protein [Kitasatospora sp. NPDC096147]|uniref:DUF2516 family protein n=1 Tax=Kitasatospora sp. NPDC096147 TaxID=3364093 RepID=UPI0037FB9CDE